MITGVDTGLWKLMAKNGVDQPQKVGVLAETLRVDPVLLGRWIVSCGFVTSVGLQFIKDVFCAMSAQWVI